MHSTTKCVLQHCFWEKNKGIIICSLKVNWLIHLELVSWTTQPQTLCVRFILRISCQSAELPDTLNRVSTNSILSVSVPEVFVRFSKWSYRKMFLLENSFQVRSEQTESDSTTTVILCGWQHSEPQNVAEHHLAIIVHTSGICNRE